MSSSRDSTPSHTPHLRSSTSLDDQSHKRKKPNTTPTSDSTLSQLNLVKDSSYSVIDIVLSGQKLSHTISCYYRQIENLCRFKHLEQSQLTGLIYEKLSDYFTSTIKVEIDQILSEDKSIDEFLLVYNQYETKLRILSRVFLYLDKNYLFQHSTKKTIIEFGLSLFVEYVLNNEAGTNQRSKIILDKHNQLLKQERVSGSASVTTEEFTKLLIKLHSTRFPATFEFNLTLIQKIIDHYNELKEIWRNQPNYIISVFTHMNQEIGFFKKCGKDTKFLELLFLKLKWNLIFYDFNNIIRDEIVHILNKVELNLLYQYCKSTQIDYNYDSMSILNYEIGCFIMNEFETKIECSRNESKSVITSLVELYNFYNTSLKKLDEQSFEFELRNALSRAVNTQTNNIYIITQLSKHIDSYFKKPEEFTNFQNYIMIIFKAITNKHEFLIFYKKDLSKRLLLNKSNISEEEKLADEFLSEIGETDEDSISLKVMFHDLQISTQDYSQLVQPDFEFVPLILEKKYWPTQLYEENTLVLPDSLQTILDNFNIKYSELGDKYKSRKLNWNNFKLHRLIIIAHFNVDIEIQCNLLQAVIILLFNDKNSYSLFELTEITLMEERLLRQVLDTLISKKLILQNNTTYNLNVNFTSKTHKVRLAMLKDKPIDVTVTNLERNRQEEYKAAIVKIMKSKEKCNYIELLNEVLELASKRNPNVSVHDLKLCIDGLITSEYLKREGDDLIYIV